MVWAVALAACATPANRRELYNTADSKSGSWHDYDRRRKAEALTGVSGGATPSSIPANRGKATAPPPSGTPGPLPPGAAVGASQAPLSPDAAASTAPPPPIAPAPGDAASPVPTPDAGGANGAVPPAVSDPTPAPPQ